MHHYHHIIIYEDLVCARPCLNSFMCITSLKPHNHSLSGYYYIPNFQMKIKI